MKQPAPSTACETNAAPDEYMIVDRVFSAVMEQRLAPRTKLNEAALCDSFGVGRMRVRRALLLLASRGIVDLHSNRGAYVACPSATEAQEVFQARMMIEPGLVRALSGDVSRSIIDGLRNHLDREDAARRRQEWTRLIRLSGEFHVELAKGHGNSVLTKLMLELVTRTSLIVGLFGVNRQAACPENQHGRIVDAIAAGDGEKAADIVRRHLEHIQEGLDPNTARAAQTDLAQILAGR